jgi:hypothetical protein
VEFYVSPLPPSTVFPSFPSFHYLPPTIHLSPSSRYLEEGDKSLEEGDKWEIDMKDMEIWREI